MRVLDRRLWRLVKASKLQFGAVVALIVVGMAAFTSLTNTAANLSFSLADFYRQFAFADLFADFAPVTASTFDRLAKLPGVKAVEARLVTDARADVGRELNPTLRLVSITPGQKINRLYVREGRPPGSGERGIALLAKFARANNLKVGDEIRRRPGGQPGVHLCRERCKKHLSGRLEFRRRLCKPAPIAGAYRPQRSGK